jgi:hypothetical protein
VAYNKHENPKDSVTTYRVIVVRRWLRCQRGRGFALLNVCPERQVCLRVLCICRRLANALLHLAVLHCVMCWDGAAKAAFCGHSNRRRLDPGVLLQGGGLAVVALRAALPR